MMSSKENKKNFVHDIEWNNEKISRFWDVQSESSEGYFSSFASKSLIRLLKKHVILNGKHVLDYGCGTGVFLETLSDRCNKNVVLYGCDVSNESVEVTNANKKLKENMKWQGARLVLEGNYLPFEDNSMDIITCFEVIEHIDDETLQRLFAEMHRVLKPKGIIMLSTPNNEKLENLTVVCPDCGCRFHRYQHMRKWTGESISCMLQAYFGVLKIYQKKINPSLFHELKSEIYYLIFRKRKNAPNLIWIGKKK